MVANVSQRFANVAGTQTALVAKYDPSGEFLWARTFDTAGASNGQTTPSSWVNGIALGNDGDIYVAGRFEGNVELAGVGTYISSAGDSDGFVAKLDGDTGDTKWAKTIGGGGSDSASEIAFSDEILYIAGLSV